MSPPFVRVSGAPIDLPALLERVAASGMGGTTLFVGTVRDRHAGRTVTALEYEAYPGMAERVLREIADEAAARMERGPVEVAVAHRTGRLAVGEPSVAVAVAAPHRAEAFAACRYIIEAVKVRLPVWKREHYADGSARWLDAPPQGAGVGSEPDGEDAHE